MKVRLNKEVGSAQFAGIASFMGGGHADIINWFNWFYW